MLCGAAVKSWVWASSPVLTRDGVGFLEYASRLKQEPWGTVLRSTDQHPVYPFAVLGLANLYEQTLGQPLTCYDWDFCAHLANMCAGLLLIVPMYFVGKRLGGRSLGFGAALFFQVMPAPRSRHGGHPDRRILPALCRVAIWTAIAGWNRGGCRGWCWRACAAAWLISTRPEAALLPICILVTLLAQRWWFAAKHTWRHTCAAVACVSLATLCVVAPYWLTIGRISSKPTVGLMTLHIPAVHSDSLPCQVQPSISGGLLLASRFQPGVNGDDYDVTWFLVLREVIKELVKGFHYILWLPAVIGIYVLARRIRRSEANLCWLLPLLLLGGNFLILMWLGYRAHYVSERHTMLMVLIGCWPAMLGLRFAALWFCQRRPNLQCSPVQLQGFAAALLGRVRPGPGLAALARTSARPSHCRRVAEASPPGRGPARRCLRLGEFLFRSAHAATARTHHQEGPPVSRHGRRRTGPAAAKDY